MLGCMPFFLVTMKLSFFFIMIIIEKSFVRWSIPKKLIITCKWSNFVSMTTRNEDSMIRNSVFSEGVGLWMFDRRTTPGCKYSQVATVMCLGCSVPGGYQAIRLVSLPLGDSMVSRTKDKKTVTQLQETWALVWLLAVQFQWWASSRCSNTFIDKVHLIPIWSKFFFQKYHQRWK